ncbi:hypothetical protein CC78DRAFT_246215 [Lojkania enalia]|uniref:HOOK N-terminal domain-containing protein n=1 Tax=Lojkania enalia TaxID=147567 RepID=A0A9P4N8C0_9PLEO|nr:hypothetical protein CC78DRAFT_246215 [Didymosphaeria enalia]
MDDFKPELLKALLDWVNTFQLPGRITAWNQLEDGRILWQILAEIDADYFNDSLPNFDESHRRTSDNWIPRWQNLKHIERAVSTYIREECEQLPVLTKRMIPDLKTGARDGSMMLTAKLTMAVLLASVFSPKSNQRMVQVMQSLGMKTGETIAEAITEMQQLDQRMAALGVDQELTPEPLHSGYRTPTRAVSGAGSAFERDSGLEQEAQLFEANKDRSALRSQVSKLKEELEKSKSRVSQLEEELIEARLHLDDRRPRTASDDVEQLKNELTRERQYIMELETDLANAKDVVASQNRRLERITADEPSKQDLRDQLQLVRAERDELVQKAKANENLKKKIQTLTQETKNLEAFRSDYQAARERLQELESIEERCTALEKVNKENSQTLVQCEQSIFEEKGKRTRVEHENLLLLKQLEQTRELQYKAEEAKRELEERLESSSHAPRGDSLEDELAQDESVENLEESTSSKTITGPSVTSDTIALQQKVDILNARLKSLETETLKQMQENLGLRSDMMTSRDEESQRPFLEQNEKLQAVEAEIEELRRKYREKDLETAELRNQLNKKADVSEEVKDQSLQAENERLLALQQKTNERLRDLELSNQEKSGLLRTALLDRDNLSPALLELKRVETLRRIREQIERVTKAPSDSRPKVLDVTASEIAETVLQSEAALDIAKKVSLTQLPSKTQNSAFDPSVLAARKRSGSHGTFSNMSQSPTTSPSETLPLKTGERSEENGSNASTGRTTLEKVAHMFRRQRIPTAASENMSCRSDSYVASLAPDMPPIDLEAQKATNNNLRAELEKAQQDSAEKGSDALRQELENLHRENRLMTSAWYDITSRLQSNTVVLQRKSEAPRSWLGKQRIVVAGAAGANRR